MSPKAVLRGEIKKRLDNLSRGEFLSEGVKAAALLRGSQIWFRYKTVLIFLSMSREIDSLSLLGAALNEGKKVFAPKVTGDTMVFERVLSPDGPWREGPFGIREPPEPARRGDSPADLLSGERYPVAADFPALILTPGLAFDREGNRLGRGRGFYDRYFAELDAGGRQYTAIGFCMDAQIVDRAPAEKTDKKMDGLLTGSELRVFA